MAAVADANGVVRGSFTIPADIPAGTKAVIFQGDGGSRGEANYTGSTSVQTVTRRRVTTVTTQRFDPLAQTFTLNEDRHIAAVDVWVKNKGTGSIRCQIRETIVGIPNQEVIAEAELSAAQLNDSPTATRFTFTPVLLEANREYALVFLTDDADHSLAIAELGKYSAQTSQWQTRQPYQIGVLLSSSNASTWTAHQEKDLRFRLHAARFTKATQEIDLGKATLSDADVLLSLAGVERPNAETDVQFIITDQRGNDYIAQENQPLNLGKVLNEEVSIKARLNGTDKLSPVLYQGPQLVSGEQAASDDYISAAFPVVRTSMLA